MIREILNYSAVYLKKNNVDLYYYDSSENDLTKQIVKDFNSQGFDNLYHIPVDSTFSYGEKIDLIFARYGIEEEYDYIWPMKDRVICNSEMLRMVLFRCDGEADVIISLSLGDIYSGDSYNIYSPVNLYRMFGKQTTSLETVIYQTERFLGDYEYGECETMPLFRKDFWHFDVLYRRLARIDRPTIGLISKNGAYNITSTAKSESYLDTSRCFEVWIEEWIRENYSLPDIYSGYKLYVIKDTTSIYELLGNYDRFIQLHKKGVLTEEIFKKYEGMWEYVTNIPKDDIWRIIETK